MVTRHAGKNPSDIGSGLFGTAGWVCPGSLSRALASSSGGGAAAGGDGIFFGPPIVFGFGGVCAGWRSVTDGVFEQLLALAFAGSSTTRLLGSS